MYSYPRSRAADAGMRTRPRARLAGRRDALDLVELFKRFEERGRAAGSCDQVQVLDAVGLTPRRACQQYLDGRAIRVGERRRERLAQLQGLGKQDAWREALRSPRLESRKDALLQLGTQSEHR